MIKESETPISIVLQTADALASNAQRLRHAHEWATEYRWRNPPAEDEETLRQAAESVERFRVRFLRFARAKIL